MELLLNLRNKLSLTQNPNTLEKELKELQAQFGELQKTVNEQNKTISKQNETIGKLTKGVETLQKENGKLQELAKKQATPESVQPKEKPKVPTESFTSDDRKWKFTVPTFMRNGSTVTAEDALTDQALLDELVAKKCSFVVEQH